MKSIARNFEPKNYCDDKTVGKRNNKLLPNDIRTKEKCERKK